MVSQMLEQTTHDRLLRTIGPLAQRTKHGPSGLKSFELYGHTTKWIPMSLPLVVLLKRTALCTFCKFLEALNVGLVEWK